MINLVADPLIQAEELWGKELREFGLPGWAMPKSFGASHPGACFGDFEGFAARWLEGAMLFGYREAPIVAGTTVILFSLVMPGKAQDWQTEIAAAAVLRMGMPDLKIELVTLVEAQESNFLRGHDFPNHIIIYRNNEPALLSNALLKKMAGASLILQIPTYYPYFELLIDGIQKMSPGPLPIIASIGSCSYSDSEWFLPMSGNICMGVLPLQRGLLLHTDVSNVDALVIPPFYFAHLESKRGYAIYLHALLTANKEKTTDLKLIVCNLPPLLSALESGDYLSYGLKEIIINDGSGNSIIQLNVSGKRLTIEAKDGLSTFDTQKLIVSAEDFVGCAHDRLFCDVASLEKFFFYDDSNPKQLLLDDLNSLTNHYFLLYPELTTYIASLTDKITSEKILGCMIGKSLSSPALLSSMKKLLYLLRTDFLFNPTLINYVKSKICEYYDPSLKEKEQLLFKEFLKGQHSLKELLCKKN